MVFNPEAVVIVNCGGIGAACAAPMSVASGVVSAATDCFACVLAEQCIVEIGTPGKPDVYDRLLQAVAVASCNLAVNILDYDSRGSHGYRCLAAERGFRGWGFPVVSAARGSTKTREQLPASSHRQRCHCPSGTTKLRRNPQGGPLASDLQRYFRPDGLLLH